MFGGVHDLVGDFEELGKLSHSLGPNGDADADGGFGGRVADVEGVSLDGGAAAFGANAGFGDALGGEEDEEFLTADAADGVGATGAFAEDLSATWRRMRSPAW